MEERIAGFDWDEGNVAKCQKHGVSIEVIENLFRADGIHVEPDTKNSLSEQRFRAVGKTSQKRAVFLVFTIRHRDGEN